MKKFDPDWELREVACALMFAERLEKYLREGETGEALEMLDHIKVFLETVRHDRRTRVAMKSTNTP
jgi:hypothetical protein